MVLLQTSSSSSLSLRRRQFFRDCLLAFPNITTNWKCFTREIDKVFQSLDLVMGVRLIGSLKFRLENIKLIFFQISWNIQKMKSSVTRYHPLPPLPWLSLGERKRVTSSVWEEESADSREVNPTSHCAVLWPGSSQALYLVTVISRLPAIMSSPVRVSIKFQIIAAALTSYDIIVSSPPRLILRKW